MNGSIQSSICSNPPSSATKDQITGHLAFREAKVHSGIVHFRLSWMQHSLVPHGALFRGDRGARALLTCSRFVVADDMCCNSTVTVRTLGEFGRQSRAELSSFAIAIPSPNRLG
jgi:hypothetical protein